MTAVEVFLDRNGESVLVGRAHFTRMRGRISTTFLYDPDYLVNGGTSIGSCASTGFRRAAPGGASSSIRRQCARPMGT